MEKLSFNPASVAINLVIGWFFMSFLQSACRSLFAGNWQGLLSRFRTIAFFHDGRATAINIAAILIIGIVTITLWQLARHR